MLYIQIKTHFRVFFFVAVGGEHHHRFAHIVVYLLNRVNRGRMLELTVLVSNAVLIIPLNC